jgi:hypothetical protein
MFFKLSLRTFWILLLVGTSLWVVAGFGPLLYSVLSPTDELRSIVRALQGRGIPPSNAVPMVQKVFEQGGLLGRAIHVGHYVGGSVKLQYGASHTMSETQDSYIAWFQNIPKPILLIVRRDRTDGVLQDYEIDSGDAASFLVHVYVPPLLSWVVSLCLVRKRKSPLLSDTPSVSDPPSL